VAWELAHPEIEGVDLESDSPLSSKDCISFIKTCFGADLVGSGECTQLAMQNEDQLWELVKDLLVDLRDDNGKGVEYNHIILAMTDCNQAAMYLGTKDQSNVSLMDLTPYISKNKVAVEQILSTIQKATEYVQKKGHESVAENSGTNQQTLQHIITRSINQLDNAMEFSDTQMAASLLD
jgi:hypothetical protein